MLGQTVGHFKIIEKIGSGGMGVVYKAQDLALDRVVALKSLPPAAIDDQQAVARLIQEARVASMLDHPNICTIHEISQTENGQVFIAMAYYEGETLSKKLKNGPLSRREALRIAKDVGSGLAKAHRHGVVHRDIKPSNIILTSDGLVKILDFGIAQLASIASTSRGNGGGTPAYMSPEQLRDERVDQRADIWAWGLVLFEMLMGWAPFKGAKRRASTGSVSTRRLRPADFLRHMAPSSPVAVLSKALQENPSDRYSQIDHALCELEPFWAADADASGRHEAAAAPPATGPVKRYTHSVRAYNLYLKGRYQWNRETPEALFKAAETLGQATQEDPRYVLPLCGLAECYLVMGARALLPPAEAWAKAREASSTALALDATLADAHACLGAVLAINDFNWGAAEREFRRGLELNANSASTRHWYAISVLAPLGRFDEALVQTTRAIEYEPLSLIYNSTLAWIYYLSGRFELAADQCSKTLEIDPHHSDSLWCLGASCGELGRFQESRTALAQLAQIAGGIPLVYGSLGHGYAKTGNIAEAERMIRAVQDAGSKTHPAPICEAWIYANLPGREDAALDCLEKAYADRDFLIRYIHMSPSLKSLCSHPRFQTLTRKMGLDDSPTKSLEQTLAVSVSSSTVAR